MPQTTKSGSASVARDGKVGATVRTDPAPAATSAAAPTREQIQKRAFEIYERRGRQGGREAEDWAQAERELRDEMARGRAAR